MSREVCGICWCPYDDDTGACGCKPVAPPEAQTQAEKIAYCAGWWDALAKARGSEERNFCPRCGKRTNDIHTCTPPHEERFCDTHCTWADHAPGCVRAEPVQEPVAGAVLGPLPEPAQPAQSAGYMPGCPIEIPETPDYYTAEQMREYAMQALAEPVQEQCKGAPGECEFNGGCMYACAKPEPDTDCHAQGICQRSGHSLGQRKPLTETSAERTLKRMGYTDCGGQFWKPPLGAPAQPQKPMQGPKPLSYADALRIATEAIGRLKSAGPAEGLVGLVRAVEAAHGIGKQE